MARGTLLGAVREKPIIGRPADVRNALIAAQRRGDFVSCTRPRLLPDGRVAVTARLVDHTLPLPRQARPVAIAVGITATVAVVGALGWVLVTAGRWVNAHLAEVAIGGVVLLLLGLALARISCRGCEITVTHRRH